MRVLVTGAAGFIGSHVTRRIVQDGHAVWAAIRPGASTDRLADVLERITVIACNLRDPIAVQELISAAQPECTIHLAWYAVPVRYWTAPENLDCVTMSLSLAQRLSAAGCRRLVGAGSCAEYDWEYGYLSEDRTPLKPGSFYGACKNAMREMLESFCAQAGMQFAWTRFFHLYGPFESKERLVPQIVLALLKGECTRCTHGEQIRDYLHVDDVASAVWAVAKCDLSGPVNIGSGQPVKIRTIVETIGQYLHREEKVVLGGVSEDLAGPPLLVANVRKLTSATGWKPSLSLKEGVANTCEWWRARINL
jgi:nucleoside-diphosphate-sugar epimerase